MQGNDKFKPQGPEVSVRMMPHEQALSGGSIGPPPVRTQAQPARGQQVPRMGGGSLGAKGNFTPASRTEVNLQAGAAARLGGGMPEAPPVPPPPQQQQAPAQAPPQHQHVQPQQTPPAPERPQLARRTPPAGDGYDRHVITVQGQAPDGGLYAVEFEGKFPQGTKILGASTQAVK